MRPLVKEEVKRALFELLEQEKDLPYPPENRIRQSFIERVKEAEKRMERGEYARYSIKDLKKEFGT